MSFYNQRFKFPLLDYEFCLQEEKDECSGYIENISISLKTSKITISIIFCNFQPELTTLTDHWTPCEAHYKGTIDKLKKIEIKRFLGDADELDFVKFLLEKGTVLQKVNIHLKKELQNDQTFKKVFQKMHTIPRPLQQQKFILVNSSSNSKNMARYQ